MPKIKISPDGQSGMKLESILPLSKEDLNKLQNKVNAPKINAYLKDMHVQHIVEFDANDANSHLYRYFKDEINSDDIHQIEVIHTNFMSFVEDHLVQVEISDKSLVDEVTNADKDEVEFLSNIVKDIEGDEDEIIKGAKIFVNVGLPFPIPSSTISRETLYKIMKYYVDNHT